MTDFSYLKNLVLQDKKEGKREKTKEQQIQELTGLTLRIYKNGEVYPSTQLVTKFNLDYKNLTEEVGDGFDIIDSTEWQPTQSLPRTILMGAVSKDLPKVDLFAGVRYNDDGTPINNVRTQGTKSDKLLNLVRSMGWLTDADNYIDLEVLLSYPITTDDGIMYVPKLVERGKTKGEATYERRENVTFFPVTKVVSRNMTDPTVQMDTERTVQQGSTINN